MDEYLEITATCTPNLEIEGLCNFSLKGSFDGKNVARLEAYRLCDRPFEIRKDSKRLYHVFDTISAYAFGLAKDVHTNSNKIAQMIGDPLCCGFLGITEIKVDKSYRGKDIGKQLISYLQELHEGMDWIVGLQAVPLEFMEGPQDACKAMQKRLIDHYIRMGFEQPAPRKCSHLLVAYWD